MGVHAVELLIDGKSNVMVGLQNGKMSTTPLEKAVKENNPINKEILRVSDIMSV